MICVRQCGGNVKDNRAVSTDNKNETRKVHPVVIRPFYERDGITIYNADCRKVLPWLDKFDLLLTDPPYGMGKTEWDQLIDPREWLPVARGRERDGHKFINNPL